MRRLAVGVAGAVVLAGALVQSVPAASAADVSAAISLTTSANRSIVLDGGPVTYTYTVTNTGFVPVEPVGNVADVVTDDTCPGVELQSGAVPLAPLETWVYTCTIDAVTPALSTNVATATVRSPTEPGQQLTATDQESIEVRVPMLTLTKVANRTSVVEGTLVTYTYVATNAGATSFEGPADRADWLTDDRCTPVTYVSGDTGNDSVLDAGEAWTFACSTRIFVTTTNTATFTGTPFIAASPASGAKQTGTAMQAPATAKVRATPAASDPGPSTPVANDTGTVAIAVTKTPSATKVVRGDAVTYTYRVTNTGSVPVTNVRLTDDTCATVTYSGGDSNVDGLLTSSASGQGSPEETWVYECTTPIVATTTNVVTATAAPWRGGVVTGSDVSATATATVTVMDLLPIRVVAAKACTSDPCVLVKASRTNEFGTLARIVDCRPITPPKKGEPRACKARMGKGGSITLSVSGYRAVKVTVTMTATPQGAFSATWAASGWERSWTIRP